EGFHGTADLAPLFDVLRRGKATRRWLWLCWLVLAVILTFATAASSFMVMGPVDDLVAIVCVVLSSLLVSLSFFFVPWLVLLLLPLLLIRVWLWVRARLAYRKVWSRVRDRLAIPPPSGEGR